MNESFHYYYEQINVPLKGFLGVAWLGMFRYVPDESQNKLNFEVELHNYIFVSSWNVHLKAKETVEQWVLV